MSMNGTCGSLDPGQLEALAITRSSIALLSYVVTAFTIVTAIGFYGAHRVFSQRLVLYSLTAALVLSGIRVVQIVERVLEELCVPLAFLEEYVLWVKIAFTCWITFYLFMLTVCSCNPSQKCQEIVYVSVSVLLPLPFACVPFVTNSYGLAGAWCWIKATDDNCNTLEAGVVEQFALTFVPLLVITAFDIPAIVVIVCILCKRAWSYDREHRNPLLPKQNHRAALKEVLPLIAYPIIFHALSFVAIANRTERAITGQSPFGLVYVQSMIEPMWGLLASITMLIHLCVIGKHKRENVHAPSFTEFDLPHAE